MLLSLVKLKSDEKNGVNKIEQEHNNVNKLSHVIKFSEIKIR